MAGTGGIRKDGRALPRTWLGASTIAILNEHSDSGVQAYEQGEENNPPVFPPASAGAAAVLLPSRLHVSRNLDGHAWHARTSGFLVYLSRPCCWIDSLLNLSACHACGICGDPGIR